MGTQNSLAVLGAAAPNSAPDGGCIAGRHVNDGGICSLCGEWLPTAWCRDNSCNWMAARGEETLQAAIKHHCETGHPIRVMIG